MVQSEKHQLARLKTVLLAALVFFSALFFDHAAAAKFTEDEVKAVYLFNFTSFISWPKASFNKQPDTFTYCSLGGESSVTKALKEILSGEKVAERVVEFKNLTTVSAIKNCQILYLSKQQKPNIALVLAALNNQPVLTVSDIKGFAVQGGSIEFSSKNGRIKLLVNVAKAKAAELSISSKLLRIADLINTDNDDDMPW